MEQEKTVNDVKDLRKKRRAVRTAGLRILVQIYFHHNSFFTYSKSGASEVVTFLPSRLGGLIRQSPEFMKTGIKWLLEMGYIAGYTHTYGKMKVVLLPTDSLRNKLKDLKNEV